MTLFLIRKAIKAYYRKIRKYADRNKQKTLTIVSQDNYHFTLVFLILDHFIYINMCKDIFIQ